MNRSVNNLLTRLLRSKHVLPLCAPVYPPDAGFSFGISVSVIAIHDLFSEVFFHFICKNIEPIVQVDVFDRNFCFRADVCRCIIPNALNAGFDHFVGDRLCRFLRCGNDADLDLIFTDIIAELAHVENLL